MGNASILKETVGAAPLTHCKALGWSTLFMMVLCTATYLKVVSRDVFG